jgi:hypothetical protein
MTSDVFEELDSRTPAELEQEAKKNMSDFKDIVDSLSSAHDKKKTLWKQIYDNAITDRRNTYIMYIDLYSRVHGNGTEHAIHGTTLAKYIERLTKANDQLIKLAEIIDEAVVSDEDEWQGEDSVYDQLEDGDRA